MKIDRKHVRTLSCVGVILTAAALASCNGSDSTDEPANTSPSNTVGSVANSPPANTIGALSRNIELASTIAPNGDSNPYFIATPPPSFPGINASSGTRTVLQPGDLLISDFSGADGANNGTSIMRYTPSTGQMSLFYQEHIGSGPVGGAISGLGTLWIANYQPGYGNSADGASSGDGNIVVTNADGADFPNDVGIIDNGSGVKFSPAADTFAGPWGQLIAVKSGTTTAYFFSTNTDAGSGTIQREEFTPGKFSTETVVTIGRAPTAANAFDPTGPQGMAYDAASDTLYVADAASNQILAFQNATASTAVSRGAVVYQGPPLNAPVGLTLNPFNGDLITVNQLDNNMIEISPNFSGSAGHAAAGDGVVVGVRLLDQTQVDARAVTGSALFGVLAVKDPEGNLEVYYTDSNTNSLNVLK